MTIVYFILNGKDCQAVFRPDDITISPFLESLRSESIPFAYVGLDENGEMYNPLETEVLNG